MGGSDRYCVICSGPLKDEADSYDSGFSITKKGIELIKKRTKELEKKLTKKDFKTYMFYLFWTSTYGSMTNDDENSTLEMALKKGYYSKNEIEMLKKEIKPLKHTSKYNWINNFILITPDNKIVKLSDVNDNWNGSFYDLNGKEYNAFYYFTKDGRKLKFLGKDKEYNNIVVHQDCYKLMNKIDYDTLINSDRKIDMQYQTQEPNWTKYFFNGDEHMLESPLKNKRNRDRVLKSFKKVPKKSSEHKSSQPKISKNNKRSNRPSPSESATLFNIGYKKKGNDGNMYVIIKSGMTKRWKKIQTGGSVIKKYLIKY